MSGKRMLKILLPVIIFAIAVSGMVIFHNMGISGGDGEAVISPAAEAETVKADASGEYGRDFVRIEVTDKGTEVINIEEGYSIVLPESMSGVIDWGGTALRVDCGDREYEIYSEQFGSEEELESYLLYSNKFIENRNDHKEGTVNNFKAGDKEIQITQWCRDKLAGIEEDKNYYICADVVFDDGSVCTVFGKFREKTGYEGEFRTAVESIHRLPEDGTENGIREYWSEDTKQVYERYFGEDSGLDWGVFKWGIDEDWDLLADLESRLDYSFDILLYYSHFESEDSLERIEKVVRSADEEGRTVELTLQTKYSEEGNMVYDILNGEYDEYLRDYAALIKKMEIPVLFRLCNEMNGDWCEYSAFHTSRDTEIFTGMYRYIFDIFMEEGAGAYTIWVWNPNEKSFPDYKWNCEFNYYPGDEYVDVVGITGYNTGTYYEGEEWRSFDEIYEPLYKRTLDSYDKPVMITEFGCSSAGGDKEKWIEDMFERISEYDEIKAAVWWDGCDYDSDGKVARSYLIEENNSVLRTFREGLNGF